MAPVRHPEAGKFGVGMQLQAEEPEGVFSQVQMGESTLIQKMDPNVCQEANPGFQLPVHWGPALCGLWSHLRVP